MPAGDPYKILGIPNTATEEEVKTAYRELAKKYHPDNYADSPLADLANEKMQEINEAYDSIITSMRANKGGTGAGQANNGYSYGAAGQQSYKSSNLSDIRRLIQQNRLVEAEELLDGIPAGSRDGEWYFLKGSVYFQRGWLDDAMNHFSTACRLSPNNPEYRAAMNRMMWQRQGNMGSPNGPYRTGNMPNSGGCSACDMCSGLICADCCCECCGGDLIPCC